MPVLVVVGGSLRVLVLVRVWVGGGEGRPCECGCGVVEGGAPEWEVGGHFESWFVLMGLEWRVFSLRVVFACPGSGGLMVLRGWVKRSPYRIFFSQHLLVLTRTLSSGPRSEYQFGGSLGAIRYGALPVTS